MSSNAALAAFTKHPKPKSEAMDWHKVLQVLVVEAEVACPT
jgi:hypothetical protein